MSLAELQLERLVRGLRGALGANLAGTYLHGSLAMGGFDAAHSDIDVLVVVHRRLTADMRRALSDLLLDVSAAPYPIELSVIGVADASLLRHPLPFELHYSEAHRDAYRSGESTLAQRNESGDADLVAHMLAVRRRGRVLDGPPAAAYLPMPRREVVAHAFTRDLEWALAALERAGQAREKEGEASVRAGANARRMARYLALNATRALAWIRDDAVLSKQEAAAQVARHVEPRWHGMVEAAAAGDIDADAELAALVELAMLQLGAVMHSRRSA